MFNRFQKNSTAVLLGIFALLALLSVYGVYLMKGMIEDERKENLRLSQEIVEIEESRNNQKNIERVIRAVENDREKLESYFYTADNVTRLIDKLEELGRQTNVEVKIGKFQYDPQIKKFGVSLTAEGSWSDVYYYMNLFEALPLSKEVSAFQLAQRSSGETDSMWSVSYTFTLLNYLVTSADTVETGK